jgi:hypothetical protein
MDGKFIDRSMQTALADALNAFPIVTVCGPRQSGKTTLCRRTFEGMTYVNLEDFTSRSFAQDDPNGFLRQFKRGAIIDEVQLVPELFSQLQVIVDENRFAGNDDCKFVITGSSNFALSPDLRQSLAGRTAVFTLLPLSTHELTAAGRDCAGPDEAIMNGGYPLVWMQGVESRRQIVENYIDTYVERDVRRLMEVKDLRKFSTFVRMCASRIGTELNKSSMAVELGISVPSVDAWLSVLQASYVVYLLQPWYANIGKRLVKSPKLYFCDTAIACNLLGLTSAEQLQGHFMRGALFENLVVNNLRKFYLNKGIREQLYFYRDKTGREIDLIDETDDGIAAYEVKSSMTFNADYFKHIDYYKTLVGEQLRRSAVVYAGEAEMLRAEHAILNYETFPGKFKVEL